MDADEDCSDDIDDTPDDMSEPFFTFDDVMLFGDMNVASFNSFIFKLSILTFTSFRFVVVRLLLVLVNTVLLLLVMVVAPVSIELLSLLLRVLLVMLVLVLLKPFEFVWSALIRIFKYINFGFIQLKDCI